MKREFRILFALQCAFYLSCFGHSGQLDCFDELNCFTEAPSGMVTAALMFIETSLQN